MIPSLASLTRRLSNLATKVLPGYLRATPTISVASQIELFDDTSRWLHKNRLERMDATVDLFDQKRRQFHLDRYRFAAQRVHGRNVLDCACGTGYGVRLLREEGQAACVLGVDIEPASVKYAAQQHGVESVQFFCASAEHLPLTDGSVDVITSFETIEHVPDDRALIQEFYRLLRPDGLLMVSTPNQWPLAETPFHVREYNRDSFFDVLQLRFDCREMYNQNSGSDSLYNHGQLRGITVTTESNQSLAECFIAVCRRKV